MESIELHDITATVLSTNERDGLVKLLQVRAESLKPALQKIGIKQGDTVIDGYTLFMQANFFETEIEKRDMEYNLRNMRPYVAAVDSISEVDPDYWEFAYVNAKNMLAALKLREEFVVQNRLRLGQNSALQDLKDMIFEDLDIAQDYLVIALKQYQPFCDGDPIRYAYQTCMMAYLPTVHRRRTFFKIRSEPNSQNLMDLGNLVTITKEGKFIIEEFSKLFDKGIFFDVEHMARSLANYANALKLDASEESYERGLAYYRAAQSIIGDKPEIIQGIDYYQNADPNKGSFITWVAQQN